MSDEIKEALNIAIELLLFSALILIVVIFYNYSNHAFVLKQNQDSSIASITEYRKIYEFSMGSQINSSVVSGASLTEAEIVSRINSGEIIEQILTCDDVFRFISKYPQDYDVYIRIDNETIELKTTSELVDWNMNTVKNKFLEIIQNSNINSFEDLYFYTVFIYNDSFERYEGAIFTRCTNDAKIAEIQKKLTGKN